MTGDISANTDHPSILVISESATVTGTIHADHVIINGRVNGPVHAKLMAQLLTSAISRFEAEHGAIANLTEPELDALLISPSDFQRRAERARAQSLHTAAKKR